MKLKVGFIGAGWVAPYHLKALTRIPETSLEAICDINLEHAHNLIKGKKTRTYDTLAKMLQHEKLDIVHVLLPPDQHFTTVKQLLEAGCHVFIEKPMCVTKEECEQLIQIAEAQKKKIGVNHNFLFYPRYEQMRKAIANREIGVLDHLTITWQKAWDHLHMGPFDAWSLRKPYHIVLEFAPHLAAYLIDLVGQPDFFHAEASDPFILPNGSLTYRRWFFVGYKGRSCIEMRLSVADGFTEESVELRGSVGTARWDIDRNIFLIKKHTSYSHYFDLFSMCRQEAQKMKVQARYNILTFIASKLGFNFFDDPYTESMAQSVKCFYDNLNGEIDVRHSAFFAANVVGLCQEIVKATGGDNVPVPKTLPLSMPTKTGLAEILVIGAAGFIGQNLVKKLKDAGQTVKLLVRDPQKLERGLIDTKTIVIKGDASNKSDLKAALEGVKYVYHLAKPIADTWKEYQEKDIEVTRGIAEACLQAGIKRLIYTGTIDTYYAGNANTVITEQTPFDPQMKYRNNYAKSKAYCEEMLAKMHREQDLPVVIVRPGIVLGEGGTPLHWGVGLWRYDSVCLLWGKGKNPLPFVLVDDVSNALIQCMDVRNIVGESFNLIASVQLSAREYLEEYAKARRSKIKVKSKWIISYFLIDLLKWTIKALFGQFDRRFPSYRDWNNRTQQAKYDNSKARKMLGWRPVEDKKVVIEEGIIKPVKKWFS